MKIVLITSGKRFKNESLLINKLFDNGLECLHIRKPGLKLSGYEEFLNKINSKYHNRIIIHEHFNLIKNFELKGAHLSSRKIGNPILSFFKYFFLKFKYSNISFSTSFYKLEKLYNRTKKFDYVFISPVFNSISNNGYYAAFDELDVRNVLKQTTINVVARGGINLKNAIKAYKMGFYGVAPQSQIWNSSDPVEEFLQFKSKLEQYIKECEENPNQVINYNINNKKNKKIIIALDGHSSCGKTTIAKSLSEKLHYKYLDTGAMYRAVTLYFLRKNIPLNDTEQIVNELDSIKIEFKPVNNNGHYNLYLNGENVEDQIRSIEVSENVSELSKIKAVRDKLVEQQRKIGKNKGIIIDGRDIGTKVFPNADLKLFLTADKEIRAERRFNELIDKGLNVSYKEILENITRRDREDTNRSESPLLKADDAIEVDNSNMSPNEQLEFIYQLAKDKL